MAHQFAEAGNVKKRIQSIEKNSDAIKGLEAQVDNCVRAKQFAEADKLQQQIQRMLDGAPPAPETVASLQQQIRDHVASGRSDKAQETACKLYLLNLRKREGQIQRR